jgi:hypothetical protein
MLSLITLVAILLLLTFERVVLFFFEPLLIDYLILSYLVSPCLIDYLILSYLVLSCLILSHSYYQIISSLPLLLCTSISRGSSFLERTPLVVVAH